MYSKEYEQWDFRELKESYDIRYSDKQGVYLCGCQPDILLDVLKRLMDEGKRIDLVSIIWR